MARRGSPKAELIVTDDEREQLQRWARRRKSSQALALRSRIVLACAEGHDNKTVAANLGCAGATGGQVAARFVTDGLDGLSDEPRPGRPPTISAERVEDVVVATLDSVPRNATYWSRAKMAERTGLSKSTIGRIWRSFELKPSSSRTARTGSSCPTTRCSWRRSTMSSGFMSTRPKRRSCCAWTRNRRSRPWPGPSRRSR